MTTMEKMYVWNVNGNCKNCFMNNSVLVANNCDREWFDSNSPYIINAHKNKDNTPGGKLVSRFDSECYHL